MVIATLGMYAGLYVVYKAFRLVSPAAAPAKPVAAPASSSADQTIPSVTDDKFQAWAQIPGNTQKWEASLDAWAKGQ